MKNTEYLECLFNHKISFLPLLCCFVLSAPVIQAADIININGGIWHSGAVDSTGAVWTWGANSAGQLGDGSNESSDYPVRVIDPTHPSGYLYDVTRIDAGVGSGTAYESHTTALKQDGSVWSWGWNAYGQLGDGTELPRTTPVRVTGLAGIGAIDVGANHSLALKNPDGTVWGWGQNDKGQLGIDPATSQSSTPVSVDGLANITAIAAGDSHGLAVKSDTSVWAWGDGSWGALGDGLTESGMVLPPVQVVDYLADPLLGITQVAAGKWFSVARKSNGTIWAWGVNESGQLGDGSNVYKKSAVPVTNLTNVTQVAAGGQHALARKDDGTVWAWGLNGGGQLGNNSTTASNVPVQVLDPADPTSKLTNVIAIGAGRDTSFALKSDGTAWGWGANSASQVGTGGGADRMLPEQILFTDKTNRLFELLGPYYITPGETVNYVVRYKNMNNEILEDTIFVVTLPPTVTYVSSGSDGIYRYNRHQAFWKLGNLAPGASGTLSLEVEVKWGLEPHTKSALMTEIGARNLVSDLDIDDYLGYVDIQLTDQRQLGEAEIQALLDSNIELKSNFQYALGLGYHFSSGAFAISLSDGTSYTVLVFFESETFVPVLLYDINGETFFEKRTEDGYELFDATGGYFVDSQTLDIIPSGNWSLSNSQSRAFCIFNCTQITAPDFYEYLEPDWLPGDMTLLWAPSCIKCKEELSDDTVDPITCGVCVRQYVANHIGFFPGKKEIGQCIKSCNNDPNNWQCIEDDVYEPYCHSSVWQLAEISSYNPFLMAIEWLDYTGTSAIDICQVDKRNGTSKLVRVDREVCHKPEICYEQTGTCKQLICPFQITRSIDSSPNCLLKDTEAVEAHDPNEKSVDITGDLLPGDTLKYTIDFENIGAGTAYEVFILDQLDTNLDETSLLINDGGNYAPVSRMLDWRIGELLGGEQGSVSFSIDVKKGLASGSEVVNIADIYFPSAGEITPTNAVVKRVATIVSVPQDLQTVGRMPLDINLQGRDTVSSNLTHSITSGPFFGELSGELPNITYTAMADFNGLDELYFTSSNVSLTSEPARITITVDPDGADAKPPGVVSTWPDSDAVGIHAGTMPLSTDPNLYKPFISTTFSEPLDRASITNASFTLDGISGTVAYDELTRSLLFGPESPLASATTYTARLSTGITDKVGNPLETEYSWQFTTAGPANITLSLPDPSVDAIDLRQVPAGSLSDSRVVTISSSGTADLNIGAITMGGTHAADFGIVDDNCSGTSLASGFHCTFGVDLQPSNPGILEATLSIASNDPVVPDYQVAVTGLGVTAPCSGDKVTISTGPGAGLVICYATESITTSAVIDILSNAEVHFVAPTTGLNSIFRVQPGGEFHAGKSYTP